VHFAGTSGGWTSSPLWTPISVIVAVAIGAAIIYLTWLLAINPQRLLFSINQTPLITDPHLAPGLLAVSYDTIPLSSPQIIDLRLNFRCRRDIPKAAFDDDKPLVFEFYARFARSSAPPRCRAILLSRRSPTATLRSAWGLRLSGSTRSSRWQS
jgi:hypothetical protein